MSPARAQVGPLAPRRVLATDLPATTVADISPSGGQFVVGRGADLVVRDTVLENYWDRGLPVFPSGQIELQAHNSEVWFKNIYVRPLP